MFSGFKGAILQPFGGTIDNVGASKPMLIDIPTGATYLELAFQCTIAGVAATRAQLETMFGSMTCTVGGKIMWVLTAKQFIAEVEFYRSGLIGDTGWLMIPLERLWMLGLQAQEDPAWGMNGASSYQLTIQQDSSSTIDLVTGHSRIGTIAEQLGAYINYVRLTPPTPGAGTWTYTQIPLKPGTFLYSVTLQVPTVADVTAIRIKCDNVYIVDTTPALLKRYYAEANPPRTMQDSKGFITLDLCNRNYDDDALPLNSDQMQLEVDFANAPSAAITLILEIGQRATPVGTPAPAAPTA